MTCEFCILCSRVFTASRFKSSFFIFAILSSIYEVVPLSCISFCTCNALCIIKQILHIYGYVLRFFSLFTELCLFSHQYNNLLVTIIPKCIFMSGRVSATTLFFQTFLAFIFILF